MKFVFTATIILAAASVFASDTTKLKLPPGFCAITIIDSLAASRQIAVNSNGDIYVKLDRLRKGRGIVVLRMKNDRAVIVNSFGNFTGSGIAIKNGYLYASSDQDVYRFKFNKRNEIKPSQRPQRIITGLMNKRQYAAKTIALDNEGYIYVNIGAPSSACQVKDGEKGSPGQSPCRLLNSSGGIWRFRTDKLNQSYSKGIRYATGIHNAVALDWNNAANDLYAMQHGRDGLSQMFPKIYNEKEGIELPAEEMLRVKKGSDFGWPYCYYDEFINKKILCPEYGGNKRKQGRCEGVDTPVLTFPGQWAPNALLFYTGDQFSPRYKNGAFIAFHSSWNRASPKQKRYKVVFVPFKDGEPSDQYEVFADNFKRTEEMDLSGDAITQPCGLAQDTDGSLYISDDVKGTIWKIVYRNKK